MDFPVSIWIRPAPSEDVAFEAVPDVLTKSIPSHLFLAAFLDLQSSISLCQINRTWRLKNICDSTNPNPLVITSYLRSIFCVDSITYDEYKKWLHIKAIFPIKKFPHLNSFTYTDPRKDPEIEKIIKYLPCLRELNLHHNLSNAELNSYYSFSNNLMSKLIGLSTLQKLNMSKCYNVTDNDVAHLSHLIPLQHLTLRWCNKITDVGVSHLRGLSNLHSLDLGECHRITDIGLSHLSNLVNLQNLNCFNLNEIDVGLSHLSTLSKLKTLILRNCFGVTDNGLSFLNKNIQTLDLFNCYQITDNGVACLSTFTRLQHLNLSGALISDVGLFSLSRMTTMKCLILRNCLQITDTGLSYLSGLTALQGLNVSCCPNNPQITDVGISHLSNIHSLTLLSFRGTQVKSFTPKEMSPYMQKQVKEQIKRESRLTG